MSQIAFDPISLSQSLQDAGMPKAQADIIARSQEARLSDMIQARELATRQDLEKTALTLKLELLRWMFGMFLAFTSVIIAAVAWIR